MKMSMTSTILCRCFKILQVLSFHCLLLYYAILLQQLPSYGFCFLKDDIICILFFVTLMVEDTLFIHIASVYMLKMNINLLRL